MTLGNWNNLFNFECDDAIFKNSLSNKLLGLTIENNLDFSDHISNICKITKQKLNTLSRASASMNSNKCRMVINSCIKFHFSYCPLSWMLTLSRRRSISYRNQSIDLLFKSMYWVLNEIGL